MARLIVGQARVRRACAHVCLCAHEARLSVGQARVRRACAHVCLCAHERVLVLDPRGIIFVKKDPDGKYTIPDILAETPPFEDWSTEVDLERGH